MSGTERTRRRLAPAVVLALALALAGCSPTAPTPTATPTPTRTPYFRSEAAALDAATKTYEAAVATSNTVLQAGGAGADALRANYVRGQLKTELAGAARYMRLGRRSVGDATVDDVRLQRTDLASPDGRDVVDTYLCLNLTDVDVIDVTGASVVNPQRKLRIPQTVTFDYSQTSPTRLAVSDAENWTGQDFCQ